MSDIAIKVKDLSKQYRLGQVGTGTLSHDLNRWWHKVRGKEDPYLKIGESNDRTKIGESDYVWALKGINFEVKEGEVLGIIGKNGAGKSTLLKLLSRVTAPTLGDIKIKGRVASLLEVGTGFHPELTGRENIYLNGAILGMSRAEINQKLDEIIDFSGTARYVETPVKRYSSGMRVRLAFAVAAHLEPEILIVDEVLAVGDAEFQNKAIGKMQDVAKGGGRTVLFVSHQLSSVQALCSKTMIMANGTVLTSGDTAEMINLYLSEDPSGKKGVKALEGSNPQFDYLHFSTTAADLASSTQLSHIMSGQNMSLSIRYKLKNYDGLSNVQLRFSFHDDMQNPLFVCNTKQSLTRNVNLPKEGAFSCTIPKLPLLPGKYFVNMSIKNALTEIWIDAAFVLNVIDGDFFASGKLPDKENGKFLVDHQWQVLA
ncbi:ABC transporter ATP-binding protein [Cesiribacter sp. SM1]|uniref:ABC transporter ATP-binding protein n=1 Tax=Cesiribacter sp. SM1 TaxID=2861196 RepID=UPI001CD43137|nr:ABC transporter ATP-binding protein [Cesiribacter sp. SM1]